MLKQPLINAILDFAREEDAATAVEYAVMLGLIVGVCIASVQFLAEKTKESFDTSGDAIAGAIGN